MKDNSWFTIHLDNDGRFTFDLHPDAIDVTYTVGETRIIQPEIVLWGES